MSVICRRSQVRCSIPGRFSSVEQCHPAQGKTEQHSYAVTPCPSTTRAQQCPDCQLGAFAGLPLVVWLSDS